jgi:hypothetical protein
MEGMLDTSRDVFQPLPHLLTEHGNPRRSGFEFEYTGLSIQRSAGIVREIFGGHIDARSTFEQRVTTDLGEFNIEIDTALLKDKKYETPLRAIGLDPDSMDTSWLENALLDTVSVLVPIEIGTPPVRPADFPRVEELRRRLHEAQATGTRASIFYAFGFHINIEIPSDDVVMLHRYLRAFVLLYPWMKQRTDVDVTRRISPYINPFPDDYVRLILQPGYVAARKKLIDDYLQYNPTRNRPLDMLPVLAHLDRDRVLQRADDSKLVKPRPAFHYRLPNCMIDEADWRVAHEWNTWVAVERLANDPARLAEMAADYLQADEASFKPFLDKWPSVLETYIRS